MNTFLRCLSASLVCGFFLLSAQAQEAKIGFVNNERVLKEAAIAKAAQTRLEQEFSKRDKDLADMRANVKTMVDKFEKDAPTMPEAQRLLQQKQLIEQDRELQRKNREFQEDLNSRRNEELQQVIARANKAIKDLAAAEKYDIIFQDVVYVNPKLDITDKVIKALNVPTGK